MDSQGNCFADQRQVMVRFHFPDGSKVESLWYAVQVAELKVGIPFTVRVPLAAVDPRLGGDNPLAGLPSADVPFYGRIERISAETDPVEVWIG